MRFVAIDVETANADMASICQIGIAVFENGKLTTEWSSLVDPEDYFDWINIDIHGITEDDVDGQPTFPELAPTIRSFLNDQITVCHTHFDRVATERATTKYNLEAFQSIWLDSARVARRTWEEVAWSGYGLANVCDLIDYKFKHHNALEDAKASGHVILAAIDKTGLSVDEWLKRVKHPIDPEHSCENIARDGNPDGPLFGEVMVFTGTLTLTRNEAATLAAETGCKVGTSVTKKTTLLVVGDQDISKLAGESKSLKHRKAENLISKGQTIRILRESDFLELVKLGRNGN